MERQMSDKTEYSNDSTAAKATWEAPSIQEIDYAQTEAAYPNPGVAEFAMYTN
jgi:hypothetical protein